MKFSILLCTAACLAVDASTVKPSPEALGRHRLGMLHREVHVPAAQKRALFMEAGIAKSDQKYYRVDRKVPLELGGTTDRANLQLQTRPEARAKDRIEHYLIEKVKRGDLTLDQAREKVVDWKHVDRY